MGSAPFGGSKMKKVLVLQGGLSSERDISLMSGQMVATALKTAGYTVVSHDLTADTDLFLKTVKQEKPDVIFNALHGRYGEDGCIQGKLNLLHAIWGIGFCYRNE